MFSYLYGLIVAFLLITATVVSAMVFRRVLDAFERRRARAGRAGNSR